MDRVSAMRCRPYGPTAWLVDEVAEPAAWAAGLRRLGHPGVHEVVPAEATVLVVCDRSQSATVGELLARVEPVGVTDPAEPPLVIDVVYDGEDLAETADLTGTTVDDVIARHTAGDYTVAFCGFSPGFAYLSGLDALLHLPRRDTPRTRVPAGAVAIAAGYSAVYPSPSPGGWHLLGTTAERLWDEGAADPAVLRPGRSVRFRRVAG